MAFTGNKHSVPANPAGGSPFFRRRNNRLALLDSPAGSIRRAEPSCASPARVPTPAGAVSLRTHDAFAPRLNKSVLAPDLHAG